MSRRESRGTVEYISVARVQPRTYNMMMCKWHLGTLFSWLGLEPAQTAVSRNLVSTLVKRRWDRTDAQTDTQARRLKTGQKTGVQLTVSHTLFFKRVLSNKINWLFSFGRKTTCVIPPRTYFLNFCFFLKKNWSFFFFFRFFSKFPFSKKNFFSISEKIPHKNGFNNKMIVQISLSGNLFVFGKKSVSPAFAEKCFYHLLLVSFIVQKRFSWKNLIRKVFSWRKTKLLLSPLDFCSIFILSKISSLFFSVLLFFQLSCYLFFLLFLIVFFWCLFFQTKKWC